MDGKIGEILINNRRWHLAIEINHFECFLIVVSILKTWFFACQFKITNRIDDNFSKCQRWQSFRSLVLKFCFDSNISVVFFFVSSFFHFFPFVLWLHEKKTFNYWRLLFHFLHVSIDFKTKAIIIERNKTLKLHSQKHRRNIVMTLRPNHLYLWEMYVDGNNTRTSHSKYTGKEKWNDKIGNENQQKKNERI